MARKTNTVRKPRAAANPVIPNELATKVRTTLHLNSNNLKRLPDNVKETLVPHRPTNAIDVGSTAFDAIGGLSSAGQVVGLRAIANGAICGAVFAAHRYLESKCEDDVARKAMATQSAIYNFCRLELRNRNVESFDLPMDLDAAYTFASSSARDASLPAQLPPEVLKIIGRTPEQVAALDELSKKNQAKRDARLREDIKLNEIGIKAEINSFLSDNAPYDITSMLTVPQHVALFQKVSKGLGKAIDRLVQVRDRYDGAVSDMILLAADVPLLDRHYVSFKNRNAGDPRLDRAEDATE